MKKSFLIPAVAALTFVSCSEDGTAETGGGAATVKVMLTDAPAKYDQVNVDIQKVEIGTSDGKWTPISFTKPGVYNLLNFRNGMDVVLGQVTLPHGTVMQMRMVLGGNNTVVVDGVSYPLTTPSAQQSGLKFNWNQTLEPNGAYNVWIDFDAGKSVVKTGNGKYILKPVIRTFSALTDGQLKGYVLPAEAKPVVYVMTASDTVASAIPNQDGFFMMKGLPQASYNVVYDADAGTAYKDATKTGVAVTYGKVTDLGNVTLTK